LLTFDHARERRARIFNPPQSDPKSDGPRIAARRGAMHPLSVGLAALTLTVLPAVAQSVAEPPASENGRYAMTPTFDGFLRLDTRTGKVSHCVVKDGGARCTLAADERDAYDAEIAALKKERDDARVSANAARSDDWSRKLPSDRDIDQTLGVMQKIWRGLNKIIRDDPPAQQGAPL
jgi:hypothetical protein